MFKSILTFTTLFVCTLLLSAQTVDEVCINFQDLEPDKVFSVGDQVVTGECLVYFDTFFFSDGTPFNGGSAGLSGGVFNVNNINVVIDFTPPLSGLRFSYAEFGGNVNLSINGTLLNDNDFTDFDGMVVAGVSIDASSPNIVQLTGSITQIKIGGQELVIREICKNTKPIRECPTHCDKCNTFVGKDAGLSNTTGDFNTFVGNSAGKGNISGNNNTYVGKNAGLRNQKGLDNAFFGKESGLINQGRRNTFIGANTGLSNIQGSGNVFLGTDAGANELGSSKLYISNTDTDSPLIWGDFSDKIVNVNGALGVGIQNPERPIHLRATNAIFRIDRDRDDPGFAVVRYDNGFNNVWKSFYFYTRGDGPNDGKFVIADWGTSVSGPSTARLVVANDGNVGIGNFLFVDPSQKLTVNGNVLATGSFITSDKRFKNDIKALPRALSNIEKLRGVSYNFNSEKFAERNFPQGRSLGLLAQEVEKVYPELVVEDGEGYKSVNYIGLIPVLVEAIKEQQEQIQAQNKKIQELEATIQDADGRPVQTPQLFQNKPNPFDQSTDIAYNIPDGVTNAMVLITDLQGKTLKKLPITQWGEGSVKLESGGLSEGIYLYTLVIDGSPVDTKRMLID